MSITRKRERTIWLTFFFFSIGLFLRNAVFDFERFRRSSQVNWQQPVSISIFNFSTWRRSRPSWNVYNMKEYNFTCIGDLIKFSLPQRRMRQSTKRYIRRVLKPPQFHLKMISHGTSPRKKIDSNECSNYPPGGTASCKKCPGGLQRDPFCVCASGERRMCIS